MNISTLTKLGNFFGLHKQTPNPINCASTIESSFKSEYDLEQIDYCKDIVRRQANDNRIYIIKQSLNILAIVGLCAGTVAAGVYVVESQRESGGYDSSYPAVSECQEGYSNAYCIPLQKGDGTWFFGRLDVRGKLWGDLTGKNMTYDNKIQIPVINGGIDNNTITYSKLDHATIQYRKFTDDEWYLNLPPSAVVSVLTPDGHPALVKASPDGKGVDLSNIIAVSKSSLPIGPEDIPVAAAIAGGYK